MHTHTTHTYAIYTLTLTHTHAHSLTPPHLNLFLSYFHAHYFFHALDFSLFSHRTVKHENHRHRTCTTDAVVHTLHSARYVHEDHTHPTLGKGGGDDSDDLHRSRRHYPYLEFFPRSGNNQKRRLDDCTKKRKLSNAQSVAQAHNVSFFH